MDPETKLYFSFSLRPGNFGATIFSALFAQYGINAVYLPRQAPSPKEAVRALRALHASGCALSAPLKERVIGELDELDDSVRRSGSCNTIVRRGERMIGFNTDLFGMKHALQGLSLERVLIYGAGGVVPSAVLSLKEMGAKEICVHARDREAAQKRAHDLGIEPLRRGHSAKFSLLINCTPGGMDPEHAELQVLLAASAALVDLAVSPTDSSLVFAARASGKVAVCGWKMAIAQLQQQFHLYEGHTVPLSLLEDFVNKRYLVSARPECHA